MKIKAMPNKVVVEPCAVPEKTDSGLVIPEKNREVPKEGVVVSSGVEGIKEGDKIRFSPYAGVEIGGYLVVELKNILGVYQE